MCPSAVARQARGPSAEARQARGLKNGENVNFSIYFDLYGALVPRKFF